MLKPSLCLAVGIFVFASAGHSYDLGPHKKAQAKRAIRFMLENVSPKGARPGTIIASPERVKPNYFRHWVRDGALVANVILSLWEHAQTESDRANFEKMLWDYVGISEHQQQFIGKPVFDADGNPISEEWGEPQNDGPALRSIVLMRFAHILRNRNRVNDAERLHQLISKDIHGILYFGDWGYDIWEEKRGFHFYTRMVHRKAVIMAKHLADIWGDKGLSDKSATRRLELEASLKDHWSDALGYIEASVAVDGGMLEKTIHLDSQVILGVLHGDTGDFFQTYDSRVLRTVVRLEELFERLYPINFECHGIPYIGRYQECNWNGYTRGGLGNPWVLTTEAFGEYYDRLALDLERLGSIEINAETWPFYIRLMPELMNHTFPSGRIGKFDWAFGAILKALHAKSDGYYRKVLDRVGEEGEFHEQIHRVNGGPEGPKRLGWSCVSTIVGHWQRQGRIAVSQFN